MRTYSTIVYVASQIIFILVVKKNKACTFQSLAYPWKDHDMCNKPAGCALGRICLYISTEG